MNHFSLSSLFICFPVHRMLVVTPSSIPCRYSVDALNTICPSPVDQFPKIHPPDLDLGVGVSFRSFLFFFFDLFFFLLRILFCFSSCQVVPVFNCPYSGESIPRIRSPLPGSSTSLLPSPGISVPS